MGFFSDKDYSPGIATVEGPQPLKPFADQAPSFGETAGAAFSLENTVGSTIAALGRSRPEMTPDPNYKLFDDPQFKGSKWENEYADHFIGSPSAAYTSYLISTLQERERHKETLSKSGFAGTVLMIGAGLIDPINLIPVTAAAGRAKTAFNFAKAGAAAGVATEGVLQATQEGRTYGESLENIASSTIMMGLLGAALGRHALPNELKSISDDIADLRGVARDDAPIIPQSGGAAAADVRTLTPVSIGIDKLPEYAAKLKDIPYVPTVLANGVEWTAEKFSKAFVGTSPTMRTFFQRDSISARRAMADLAETPLRFEDNNLGVPTNYGGAIDRVVKNLKVKLRAEFEDTIMDMWKQHYYGPDEIPYAAAARSNARSLLGQQGPAGKMEYRQFGEEVSRAMWSGDQHPVPQVQQAAQTIRKTLKENVVKRAVDAGLFKEEDIIPKGDKSWFPRLWNREAVTARRPEFKKIIADFYESEQATKAAIKDKLQTLAADHAGHVSDIEKLERKLEQIERKRGLTDARMRERALEAKVTGKRAARVDDRLTEVQQAISDLEEFLADIRRELPEARAHAADLENELNQLKAEAKPLSAAEEARIAKEGISAALPDDAWVQAAQEFIGRRKPIEPQSFSGWLIGEGGVKDFKGELRSIFGKGTPSRVINNSGRTLDEIGERLYEIAPWAHPNGRPDIGEVLEYIRGAANGENPPWWREYALGRDGAEFANDVAFRKEVLADIAEQLGVDPPKSLRGVSEMLANHAGEMPAVLQRLEEKAAASAQVPGAEASLEVKRTALQQLRDYADRAIADRNRMRQNERVEGARAGEAGIGARRNRNRLEVLQDRLDTQQKIADLYTQTIDLLENRRVGIRDQIEAEIKDWKGDSSATAIRMLEAREEALAARQQAQAAGTYKGRGERLRSADKAVDRAVKHIIESERDLPRLELESRADETINRILSSPNGRLPYDEASGGPRIGFTGKDDVGTPRGSWAGREFAIPTEQVKEFIERDPQHALGVALRTLLPDIELAAKFGDVDMKNVFRQVDEEFAALSAAAKTPAEQNRIEASRTRRIGDLAAVRDRIRGVYGWSDNELTQKAGRFAQAARNWSTMTDLGTSTLNSMPDLAGMTFRYAFTNVFKDGWQPFLKQMVGMESAAPAIRRQAKAMAIGYETHFNLRGHELNDIIENYKPGTPFERALNWGAEKSQLLNIQAPFTDQVKTMVAGAAMQEFLRIAEKIAKGKATQKDIGRMAAASIDPQSATKIYQEFMSPGGHDVVDGVRIPNTEAWKDGSARRLFEYAINREADIAVVTPGQEKPLWMSRPIAGLLGQFKSFIAGTHERLLIAQLQQRDIRTLQGVMTAVAMGILSYRLYTLATGKPMTDNPSEIIKEGISRSGVIGWFDEINSQTAKASGGKADIYRAIGAEKELSRYQSRSILSALLGPVAGKVEAAGQLSRAIATGEVSASDVAAGRRLVPLQNHFLIRRPLNHVEDATAEYFGATPTDRTR